MSTRNPSLGGLEEPAETRRGVRDRRTLGERLLLTVGVLLSLSAFAVAATAGWAAWKLRSIDRTDVALDQAATGAPANYLIVGSDTRSSGDPNDPKAVDDHKPLADTIMVVRVDPAERRARILSLPRDLWVTMAGTGEQSRINSAYATGGPQHLIDTLQEQLDIPVNHYVEVDFHGFQQVVGAVDGVPIWFDRAMRDRNSGLDVLHPGCTTLDGNGALAFARARHLQYFNHGRFTYDGTGDLGRISRQQLFMRRLIDRAKTKGIGNPLTLKRLVDAGTSNVTLDNGLAITDLLALGRRFGSFRSGALASYTLPATPRTTKAGAQVLDLDAAAAQPILDRFRPEPKIAVGAATTPPGGAQVVPAPADLTPIWVLDSSGRPGLAAAAASGLQKTGWKVAHAGNGTELSHADDARTTIRFGSGADATVMRLVTHLAGGAAVEPDATLPTGRVVLFVGHDFNRIATGSPPPAATTAGIAPNPDGGSARTGTTTAVTTGAKVVGVVPGDPPHGESCT